METTENLRKIAAEKFREHLNFFKERVKLPNVNAKQARIYETEQFVVSLKAVFINLSETEIRRLYPDRDWKQYFEQYERLFEVGCEDYLLEIGKL